MKISRIDTDHFRIPLPTPLSDSTHGVMTHFGLITARITSDEGAEGLGYTYCVGDIGGSAIHALIRDGLAPGLIGEDPGQIERLWEAMWWRVHFVGRGGLAAFAMAAVDIALWDMKARIQNEPWWRMLGGHDPQVACYAGGIDLDFPLDQLIDQTDNFLEQGFRAIKMKVGRPRLAEDVERVAAMRAHLGEDFPLMADANMRWRVDQAIRAARSLAPFHLVWLEEPIIPDDIPGHARVAQAGGLPIATGENFHTMYEFQQMIAHGGISFPEPDVATLGGVTPWLKVAHLAETCNLPVTTHGVHDLQVHLLAAIPNSSYLEAHGFGLDRFIEHPLRMVDGRAVAPDRPGHGVTFDWEQLARHRA